MHWPGFDGEKPVRVGNAAALHSQHDVFGEMVLALTPMFLDARFREQVTPAGARPGDAARAAGRSRWPASPTPASGNSAPNGGPQTFSSLMCWAAADRMSRIARIHPPSVVDEFAAAPPEIRAELLANAVDAARGCLVADYGGQEVDAALLQAVTLRLLAARRSAPVAHRRRRARRSRPATAGSCATGPTTASACRPSRSSLCTFWLVEALALVWAAPTRRAHLERVRDVKSPLGLLSEDFEPASRRHVGQLPAGVLARRPHPRGVRCVAALARLRLTPSVPLRKRRPARASGRGGSDQPVTRAANGVDHPSVLAELVPQALDVDVDEVRSGVERRPPHLGQ